MAVMGAGPTLFFLFFAGCVTSSLPESGARTIPAVEPGPYVRIGSLVDVNHGEGIAVLRKSLLHPPEAPGSLYIARDADLKPTAVLQRRIEMSMGEFMGFIILEGYPETGNEVVFFGNEDYREWIHPFLSNDTPLSLRPGNTEVNHPD